MSNRKKLTPSQRGKLGGKATSPKKRRACKVSLAKARTHQRALIRAGRVALAGIQKPTP